MSYDHLINVQAARERVLRAAENRGMLKHIPTKAFVKDAKKSFRANAREHQKHSMLNMPRPAGHRTVPKVMDERTKVLFAAHEKRKETWVRG